jgi:Pyridoxamine 5'-phosphate oxidase
MDLLRKARVARVVGGAPFAYLAVETASGPHVTPLLFAATPDRLWFGIGRRTLKARAVAKRPAVGVVVPGEEGSLAVVGTATLLDRFPVSPGELGRAPFAGPAYAARNALEMAAFARDLARKRSAQPPPTPLSVRVESYELLDGWPAEAVLGWLTPDGPIALPARWDAEASRARVPASMLRAAGGPRTAAACICVDESSGRGPLAKSGRMLRGQGHARIRGDTASIALDVERVTRWRGFETQTRKTRSTAKIGSTPRGGAVR